MISSSLYIKNIIFLIEGIKNQVQPFKLETNPHVVKFFILKSKHSPSGYLMNHLVWTSVFFNMRQWNLNCLGKHIKKINKKQPRFYFSKFEKFELILRIFSVILIMIESRINRFFFSVKHNVKFLYSEKLELFNENAFCRFWGKILKPI